MWGVPYSLQHVAKDKNETKNKKKKEKEPAKQNTQLVLFGSLRALGGAQVPIFHSGAVTKRGDDLATLTLHDLMSSADRFAFANWNLNVVCIMNTGDDPRKVHLTIWNWNFHKTGVDPGAKCMKISHFPNLRIDHPYITFSDLPGPVRTGPDLSRPGGDPPRNCQFWGSGPDPWE